MAKHILVFGSPGSGKSIFSAALAKEVIKHKKRAIIVGGDMVIPMLPFFCGDTDTVGLGTLCKGEITPQALANAVKVLKKYPDIGVMGLQFDDDPSEITIDQMLNISNILDELVDVVIWDGTSDLDSPINCGLWQKSVLQIGILTADVKGILYFENYREIIHDKDKCILLEGLAKPYTPYEEMNARTGGLYGRLYYAREIERICLEGKIFSIDQVCHEEYTAMTEKIVEQVLHGKEE